MSEPADAVDLSEMLTPLESRPEFSSMVNRFLSDRQLEVSVPPEIADGLTTDMNDIFQELLPATESSGAGEEES